MRKIEPLRTAASLHHPGETDVGETGFPPRARFFAVVLWQTSLGLPAGTPASGGNATLIGHRLLTKTFTSRPRNTHTVVRQFGHNNPSRRCEAAGGRLVAFGVGRGPLAEARLLDRSGR